MKMNLGEIFKRLNLFEMQHLSTGASGVLVSLHQGVRPSHQTTY